MCFDEIAILICHLSCSCDTVVASESFIAAVSVEKRSNDLDVEFALNRESLEEEELELDELPLR